MNAIVEATPIDRGATALPKGESCVLVIFGASGDLTRRKLIPALYDLACIGCTNPQFDVLGIGRTPTTLEEFRTSEQDYDSVVNVNLKGTFFVTQAVVQHWIAVRQVGKIINISSVHEELPFPHFATYCASKGGLKMLARDFAVELAPFGITINNIAPGAIETPINKALLNDPAKLQPLLQNILFKRLGTSEDVSGVAAFLASPDADYISGTTLFVDGGLLWSYQER